jgi:hypothetical protein
MLGAAVLVCALTASAAQATFHENVIREVHASLTGDYVELQAYAAGQNHVATTRINTYDGGGGIYKTVQIPADVANGSNQATILIAQNATIPGADFIDNDLDLVNTGGTVCFSADIVSGGVDCVAYGTAATMYPVLPLSPFGTPFDITGLPGGDLNGHTLIRSIAKGCATTLDPADDTNNSAADFTVGTGNPRGNASPITETPCPTIPPGQKKKCPKGKKLKTIKKHGKKKKKCVKKKKKHHKK